MDTFFRKTVCCLLAILFAIQTHAQNRSPRFDNKQYNYSSTLLDDLIEIPRLSGAIRFDGVVDESAWDAIEPFPIVVQKPTYGQDPTETTEFRIGYNNRFLYFSARCYDSELEGIIETTFGRD